MSPLPRWYELIVTIALYAGAIGSWYFVVMYHIFTRGTWGRWAVGQHLMGFTINLALLFTLLLVNREVGDYKYRLEVTAGLFCALVLQILARNALLHWSRRQKVK